MPETTSGLGRNGPWLQNGWLRVESRLDDASIAPVSLAGAFRPIERGIARVEPIVAPPLSFSRAEYDVRPYADPLGNGRRLSLTSRDIRRGVVLRRDVVLYDEHPYAVTRVGVTNEGAAPLDLGALVPFASSGVGRGSVQLPSNPAHWRIYRNGWQSWSPTMSFGGADRDVRSAPPVLSPEPPQQEHGRFSSNDVGVLYDSAKGRSLLAGIVSARDFLTETFIDAPARTLVVRCHADGIAVVPGETLWSEQVVLDLCDAPLAQLERYGDALGRQMGARVPPSAPSGWCSWYYFFTDVAEDDILRNLRFLEAHRRELPIDTVQIDDGYQADIGDWLTTNEKFPRGMAFLASEIKGAGYRPGIWLAPFLLAESSRTFADHPDWIVRGDDGAPVLAQFNWRRNNWGLDGSHPEARAWLTNLFREICDGWRYDYVKIDFLFGAAVTGRRADPATTRARAYRQALAAVREGVGRDRFILGCGSLMAPSVGFFDGNRIGPDVAPWWRFLTTEDREAAVPRPRTPDDNLSAETAIRNTLTRSWMHGHLWANDPDCVLVRDDRTKLTLDEVRSLATAIGLSAGMVLASDDMEKVPKERLAILSMLLPPLPRPALPLDLMDRDMPEHVELVTGAPHGPERLVALFNFCDEPRDLALDLPDGEWHVFELWQERYAGRRAGHLVFPAVEAHACRLLAMRRVDDRPCVLATTAHIGMGLLDISREAWEPDARTLRVTLAPAGRQARRIALDTAGATAADATFSGTAAPVHVEQGIAVVDVTVDAPGELVVEFS